MSTPYLALNDSPPVRRFRVITSRHSGSPGRYSTAAPSPGGHVDGVSGYCSRCMRGPYHTLRMAIPGRPAKIEAGEAFSSGALLATDGQGRAVVATGSQIIVARALEPSTGAGDAVSCILETQRPRGL